MTPDGGPPATAERSVGRRDRAVVVPLAVLALFCVCLAVFLVFSPLNETPDTYCQTVTRPPAGQACSPVIARRWQWIEWVLAVAAVLAVSAAFPTIGRNHDMCGSTLSRVDEHGLYAPDRPKDCVSRYAASRGEAWVFGLLALAVFAAGAALEGRAGGDVAALRD